MRTVSVGWGWKLVKVSRRKTEQDATAAEEVVAVFRTHRSLDLNRIEDLVFEGSGAKGQLGT